MTLSLVSFGHVLLLPCLLVSSYPATLFSLSLVLVYVICVHLILLYIVPLSLMSLLVRGVSSLCVREFIVSQLVLLVVLFFYSPCVSSFAFSSFEVLVILCFCYFALV